MDHIKKSTQTKTELKEQRLQELLNSCQQQVLQQLVGPFGLTPAMFDDKTGGNVTTQHNADQGIFAQECEEYNRASDYDYSKAKKDLLKQSHADGTMNSQTFVDKYTGKEESTRRITESGQHKMNAELDHTIPLAEAHRDGAWMLDKAERKALASDKDNLHFTTMENNRKKGGKSAEEFLSEENGFDPSVTQPLIDKARESVDKHLPTEMERLQYHGKQLAMTGAKEAGKNALRQAFGVLLYEFVNGAFIELKSLKSTFNEPGLIDRLIAAFKRVANRVISKLSKALDAAVQGGVQGFVSNLLTFIINTVITTSAKVVTIIREGMKGLWEAIKMMVNPPKNMSFDEVCRQVSKIIAGVVTMALGMLFEESIKAFILSIPLLAPLAEIIAPAIAGILTGVMSALVVFGLDHLFDWLADKGTELLQAQEAHLDEMQNNLHHMADLLEAQYQNSALYQTIAENYLQIGMSLETATEAIDATNAAYKHDIVARDHLLTELSDKKHQYQDKQQELEALMSGLNIKGWSV
ncbi:AI-2E family transporter [Shewanella xiamenensis]|uniref:AI-2E family transporter n=1 Tax=Shewanella xiamenensis TaxID=332186 RepID=UPI0008497D20|nr:hypothetical protein [Shewanella xiamenensis]ODR87066.1 hypothetical protein ABT47_18195 [Shewanella xiamenensis]